tara:strand:+ start:111 stop:278 length:168 start_codon:yes stop_codon:yes gene_type:complete
MFLTDVQEEIMDALLYIEAAKRCLQDEVEDCMIKRYYGKDPETGKEYIVNDEEEL